MSAAPETIAHRLHEANVRIDAIWPVPQPCPPAEMLSAFEDHQALPPLLIEWAGYKPEHIDPALFDGDSADGRDAWEEFFGDLAFRGKQGFILKTSTPVITPNKDGRSYQYSWGYLHQGLTCAATVEDGIEQAIRWAEQCRQQRIQQAAAGGAE